MNLDDRMQIVISAYYKAVAEGNVALATSLATAIDKGDVEAGLRILESPPYKVKPPHDKPEYFERSDS